MAYGLHIKLIEGISGKLCDKCLEHARCWVMSVISDDRVCFHRSTILAFASPSNLVAHFTTRLLPSEFLLRCLRDFYEIN